MADSVGRAQRFVQERYPEAVAAFLGGSAASDQATSTSDLDILVVLPDGQADASFVETLWFEDQLVEAFCYGSAALQTWLEKGRHERRPVLDKLIGEGLRLTVGPEARTLQDASGDVLSRGPVPLTRGERRLRAYSLSAVLDDLIDAIDPGERFVLAATAWRESAELSLSIDRRWLGSGKWLLRELRLRPDRFGLVAWASGDDHDTSTLVPVCRAVLEAAGGYLQDGFVRGSRPLDA